MLVDPNLVPGGDLDAEAIEDAARNLRRDASAAREAAGRVAGAWQGLGACYEAPETDQVLRALDPVTSGARRIAGNLEQVAAVLERFAVELRGIGDKRRVLVADMHDLRSQAADAPSATFAGGGLAGMPGMVPPKFAIQNAALAGRAVALAAEIEDVERDCARRIEAIGAPASWGQKAWDWAGDVVGGIGASIGQAAQDLGEAWNDGVDLAQDAWDSTVQWTDARVRDVQDWVGDRAENIDNSWRNWGESVGLLYESLDGTAEDPRPQFTAVGASYLQAFGAALDAWGTTLTLGHDIDFADDGEPWAGEPIKYDEENIGQVEPTDLRSVDDLLRSVTASYETNVGLGQVTESDYAEGYVRVTKIVPPDGPDGEPGEPMMVVSIPGTQPWFHWDDWGNDHPADWIGNLVRAGGGRTTYSDSVGLAIDRVIESDPSLEGASVMLVGHSQGGMTAADLGSDARFVREHHVTDVVTFGSPIANDRIHESVNVIEFAHDSDIVPQLDTNDVRIDPQIEFLDGPGAPLTPPNPILRLTGESTYQPDPDRHTSIALADPQASKDAALLEKYDIFHDHRLYSDSVAAALTNDQALIKYQSEISGSDAGRTYLYEKSTFEVYDVPVKRID